MNSPRSCRRGRTFQTGEGSVGVDGDTPLGGAPYIRYGLQMWTGAQTRKALQTGTAPAQTEAAS